MEPLLFTTFWLKDMVTQIYWFLASYGEIGVILYVVKFIIFFYSFFSSVRTIQVIFKMSFLLMFYRLRIRLLHFRLGVAIRWNQSLKLTQWTERMISHPVTQTSCLLVVHSAFFRPSFLNCQEYMFNQSFPFSRWVATRKEKGRSSRRKVRIRRK